MKHLHPDLGEPTETPQGPVVQKPGSQGGGTGRGRGGTGRGRGGGKRKAGSDGGGGGGKRKAGSGGDGDGDGGGDERVAPMDVANGGGSAGGDAVGEGGIMDVGGGSDGEWSAGGNDGADGGGGPSSSGGDSGDAVGEGGITDIGGDSDGDWSAGGNDGADGGGGPSSSGGSDADGEGDISSDGNSGGSGISRCDSSRGDRGSSSRGSSARGSGSRAPPKKSSGKKQPPGMARMTAPDMGRLFTTPDPGHKASDTERIAKKREQSDLAKKHRAKTVSTAGRTAYGVGTVPGIAKMLTGLTKEPNNGNLLINEEVYFDRDRLEELKFDFNTAYMFNPIHIGVALKETKVEIDERELVVSSFDNGKYKLEDGTEIGQWELLEKRCDGGVTLDDECRRFVRYLVTVYTSMMARGVPFDRDGGNMSRGMLWNVKDAIARLESGYFDVDEDEMDLQELRELEERLVEQRTLILEVFTGMSVEDTLPQRFWPEELDGEASELRRFANDRGSMAKLNFLGGLRVEDSDDMVGGSLFTGDVVTGPFSVAPKPLSTSGAWSARLANMIHLLSVAYRQGRTVNFLEGHVPLSTSELATVERHHRQCAANLKEGCGDAYVANQWGVNATPDELVGDKAYALRFANMRAKVVLPVVVPVMIHTLGLRDAALGKLAASSADTGGMCLSRTGGHLLQSLLKNTPSGPAVERIIDKSKKSVLDKIRAWRARHDAQINGAVGKSNKQRKCKIGLVEDSQEERERSLEMYMRLVRVNGMRPVMKAIEEIDPKFVEWGMTRLVEAEDVSTTIKREDIRGTDHLFGGTPEEVDDGVRGVTVADGKRKVADLADKLEAAGINPQTFAVFSVGTMLAIEMSGACIRPEDFFFLEQKTMWFDSEGGILKIGMPIDGKQTDQADQDLSMVCKFHDIEGHDVVRWCMVMALVGREVLGRHNGGRVNEMFGPLQTTGQQISPETFGKVFKELGRSFFGMGNMAVNAMRTVQDTIAVEHGLQMGLEEDNLAFKELARQQRTGLTVSPVSQ